MLWLNLMLTSQSQGLNALEDVLGSCSIISRFFFHHKNNLNALSWSVFFKLRSLRPLCQRNNFRNTWVTGLIDTDTENGKINWFVTCTHTHKYAHKWKASLDSFVSLIFLFSSSLISDKHFNTQPSLYDVIWISGQYRPRRTIFHEKAQPYKEFSAGVAAKNRDSKHLFEMKFWGGSWSYQCLYASYWNGRVICHHRACQSRTT